MSRILRRPMFRGGQVIDSRGTGITSGLYAAGGAVETPKICKCIIFSFIKDIYFKSFNFSLIC